MIQILKKFLTREENASGVLNGLWQAALVAVPTGIVTYQGTGSEAQGILAGVVAGFLALGGRVAEGVRKGVKNDAESVGS